MDGEDWRICTKKDLKDEGLVYTGKTYNFEDYKRGMTHFLYEKLDRDRFRLITAYADV
ncbi:MAG: hypothetical protein QMD85_00070 [Candidatus Aenigmarchaeota archaeon]|nr:hypothetical protein [Candidatus Aenigmarchaeota archaeon]MDI6721924.1 hypothetical protein [Candidatus Aenigmarchaeota archaeon]